MNEEVYDDKFYINHVLDCIDFISTIVSLGDDNFYTNRIHRDAVLRNMQVLCESAKRISMEIKSELLDVPWRGILDFRNILVHQYHGIDTRLCGTS